MVLSLIHIQMCIRDSVSIENGKATGTISGLAAGDYTVAIKYVGDDKYTCLLYTSWGF